MNSETSRKVVVAGSMAAVLAIGILVVAMRHQPAASVAAVTPPPAPTADNVSPAPEAVQTPPAPQPMPLVASVPTSPASAAHGAVESTPAPARPRAKQNSDAAMTSTVTKPAAVTAAPDADSAKTADAPLPPATADNAGTGVGASNGDANTASDPQITSEVKSVLADDSVAKDSNIDVNTSQGVVALTGSVPDQSVLDHVVAAVSKVKDVRRVDASAVTVTNL
jgi:hypothetical protein